MSNIELSTVVLPTKNSASKIQVVLTLGSQRTLGICNQCARWKQIPTRLTIEATELAITLVSDINFTPNR